MSTKYATPIVHDGQSCIQVGIVTEHLLYYIIMEAIMLEKSIVWFEIDVGSILISRFLCFVALEVTFLKRQFAYLPITVALHLEMRTQRINSFHTYSIQANTLLERFGVILTTRIQH